MKHDQSSHNGCHKLSLKRESDLAKLVVSLARSDRLSLPIMLCFFSGRIPAFATPMPRDPVPEIGAPFDEQFFDVLEDALMRNQNVHDGAIMLGRVRSSGRYKVAGWSHRLHPPAANATMPNKGSAFNSCAAMSSVPRVDALYLISRDGIFAFCGGVVDTIDM